MPSMPPCLPFTELPHPDWCDPRTCRAWSYPGGGIEVFHSLMVVEIQHYNHGRLYVEVVQYVHLSPNGAVLVADTNVFVEGLDAAGRLPYDDVPDVAAALELAGELLGHTR